MNRSIVIKIFSLVIIFMVIGCKDSGHYQSIEVEKAVKTNLDTHKVIAKEIQNAGMYTYIKVSENNEEYWVAIPKSEIEIGKEYYYKGGMKMVNFESKELNKTFDTVWFLDTFFKKDPNKINLGNTQNIVTPDVTEIIEQPGNGTSVEKLLSDSESFSNKEIVIKGKVVKVNKNILNRNWVHLKDGTGFKDKTEITISTTDTVKLGDVLTFKGLVTLDKDFGYGYVYPVLLENGQVLK